MTLYLAGGRHPLRLGQPPPTSTPAAAASTSKAAPRHDPDVPDHQHEGAGPRVIRRKREGDPRPERHQDQPVQDRAELQHRDRRHAGAATRASGTRSSTGATWSPSELQDGQLPADHDDLQQHRRRQLRRVDERQAEQRVPLYRRRQHGDQERGAVRAPSTPRTSFTRRSSVTATRSAARSARRRWDQSMDGVVFRDIDVVKAGRALNIDAYDTAVVTEHEVREHPVSKPPIQQHDRSSASTCRPTGGTRRTRRSSRTRTSLTSSSDVKKPIALHGKSAHGQHHRRSLQAT